MGNPRGTAEYRRKRATFLSTHPHICHWCGAQVLTTVPRNHPRKATVDHLIEVDRAAALALDETVWVVACHSCNSSRGATYGNAKRGAMRKASRDW